MSNVLLMYGMYGPKWKLTLDVLIDAILSLLIFHQTVDITYVFPKPSSETRLVLFQDQTAPAMTDDSFQVGSCRPIEFYGRPSVVCDGEETTMVYTLQLFASLLTHLDGNIMLGRVICHLAGSAYHWVQEKTGRGRAPIGIFLSDSCSIVDCCDRQIIGCPPGENRCCINRIRAAMG